MVDLVGPLTDTFELDIDVEETANIIQELIDDGTIDLTDFFPDTALN